MLLNNFLLSGLIIICYQRIFIAVCLFYRTLPGIGRNHFIKAMHLMIVVDFKNRKQRPLAVLKSL